jgi:mono/diheme cytochrome c family protein
MISKMIESMLVVGIRPTACRGSATTNGAPPMNRKESTSRHVHCERRPVSLLTTLALATAVPTLSVLAVVVGNARDGLFYAQKNCAECHAVSKEAEFSPKPDSPRFVDVANTRGMTAMALTVFLRTPHATMPNLVVPTADIDNLIAYILSLRTPG